MSRGYDAIGYDEGGVTLGHLIDVLEASERRIYERGFREPHSYRGYYRDLAFVAAFNVSRDEMLDAARAAVGATYYGWKGGNFTMHKSTEVFVVTEQGCTGSALTPTLLALLLGDSDPWADTPWAGRP